MKKLQTDGNSIIKSYQAGELPAGSYRAYFKGDFNGINSASNNGFTTLPATYQIGSTNNKKEIKKEQLDTGRDGWNYAVDEDRNFLKDDFSSGTIADRNWVDINDSSDWSIDTNSKTLRVVNSTSHNSILRLDNVSYSPISYEISADICVLTTASVARSVQFQCNYIDDNNHYDIYVSIDSSNNASCSLDKYENGINTISSSANVPAVPLQWHNFKVIKENTSFKIYFDNTLVISETDPMPLNDENGGLRLRAYSYVLGGINYSYKNLTIASSVSYSDSFTSDTSSRYQAISGSTAYDSTNTRLNLTAPAGTWNKTRLKSYKFESGKFTQKLILPTTGHEGDIVACYFAGSADMAINYGVGVTRLSTNLWLPVEIKDNVIITTGTSPIAPIQDGDTVNLEVETDMIKGVSWLNCWNDGSKNVMTFDGVDDYIDCGSNSVIIPTSLITVCATIYTTENKAVQFIAGHGNTSNIGWVLDWENGQIGFKVGNGTISGWGETQSTNQINTWYRIVGVYDGSTVKVYVNGAIGTRLAGSLTGSIDYTGVTNTWIGQLSGAGSSSGRYFKGNINNVRVYSRAWSQAEVMDDYKGKYVDPTGLVASYANTGNTNADWVDRSGNGNNGTVSGSPATTAITGSKLQGTTLKQFAPYSYGYNGVGFKNSRVTKNISTSDVVTNDFSITKASLDICPYAVPAGSVLYDGNSNVLTKSETVTTQTGNVDIYDIKSVITSPGTIKTRVWDSSAGDCKVWDTVTSGGAESGWARVYSTSWVFSGDCVIDNGLVRVYAHKGPQSTYGTICTIYNGSVWETAYFKFKISAELNYSEFIQINSFSSDSISIQMKTHGSDSAEWAIHDYKIKRGSSCIETFYVSSSSTVTGAALTSASQFVYGSTGVLGDSRLNADTSFNGQYGAYIQNNRSVILIVATDVSKLINFAYSWDILIVGSPSNVSRFISIPFDCSKLYYDYSTFEITGSPTTVSDANTPSGYAKSIPADNQSYVLTHALTLPAGDYVAFVRANLPTGATLDVYAYDFGTGGGLLTSTVTRGAANGTYTTSKITFTIASGRSPKVVVRGLTSYTQLVDYIIVVPVGIIEKYAKRALFNLVETTSASDKLVSLKLLESRARSLIGYTNVPTTETFSFVDDFNEDSSKRWVGVPSTGVTFGYDTGTVKVLKYNTLYPRSILLPCDIKPSVITFDWTPIAVDGGGIFSIGCIGFCLQQKTGSPQIWSTISPYQGYGVRVAYCSTASQNGIIIYKDGVIITSITNFGFIIGTKYHVEILFDSSLSTDIIKVKVWADGSSKPSSPNATSGSMTAPYTYGSICLGVQEQSSPAPIVYFDCLNISGTRYSNKPMFRGAGVGSYWDGSTEIQTARFSDDFEYGSIDSALTYNYTWEIVDNKIHKKKSTTYNYLCVNPCKFGNGDYRFKWTPTGNATSTVMSTMIPVFCCDSTTLNYHVDNQATLTNKLYYMYFRTDITQINIFKRDGTITQILLGYVNVPTLFTLGKTYDIRINLNNGVIKLYVDNTYIGSVTDSSPLSAGYFGLTTAYFSDNTGHEGYVYDISINAVPDISTQRLLGGVQYGGYFLSDGNPNNTGNWAGFKFTNHDRDTVYTSTLNRGACPVVDSTSYKIVRKNVSDGTQISTKAIEEDLSVTTSAATITTNDITLNADDTNDNIGIYTQTKVDSAPILPLQSQSLVRNTLTDTTLNGYYYIDFDVGDDALDVGIWETGVGENHWTMDYILVVPIGLIEKHAKRALYNLSPFVKVIKSANR